jgi:hypothetical protein
MVVAMAKAFAVHLAASDAADQIVIVTLFVVDLTSAFEYE